jgi:peroxiredoxin
VLNYSLRYRSAFLLLFAFALSACQQDDEEGADATSVVNVGDKIPTFVLDSTDGQEVSSSSVSGKVYILNFFDTGCPDCRQELGVLQQIYNKYQAVVPVLNVPRSQTKDEVNKYWAEANLSMPFYTAQDKSLYYKFATRGIPRTYVVDENGKVLAAFSDSPTADFNTLDSILEELVSDQTVNLSIKINVPTRASDGFYFFNEYAITYFQLWFFDAETKKFSSKLELRNPESIKGSGNGKYDISYMCENVRLKVGVYDIFAVANYFNGPDKVDNEYELLNMIDSETYFEGIEPNISDNGPVMTSQATDKLNVDLIPWINKEYVLTIDVERVLAKLQIGVSNNFFSLRHNNKKYADVNITNYKLVNLNTQYYLFQHTDYLSELSEQPEFKLPDNFNAYSERGNQYVVDPLFYKKKPNAEAVNAFSNYYKSWYGTFTTTDFASMPTPDNYGYAYLLENTSYKSAQKNGYSPGIIFKANVSPVFVYLYNSQLQALEEEYRPDYWPKPLYLYNYNFYSIEALNFASGLKLDDSKIYTDAQLKEYGIKKIDFNMGVYETNYAYWIVHRNSEVDPMGPMQYGLVRNNYYKIIVKGITGLGYSVITPEILRDNYPNSYADMIVESSSQ